ncbi:flocculation protein FLO11-like [Siniperca chuatsi]|uniref:flocculation protein FLO11-like n=1 Tax=Siniperca chuatsi TaxID=119488 RepID=UPI001CE07719|nr:flocculation protein FLO11-like [Siniperca chuatsi]XP_044031006.1 flocculation protein FLO11-like [Siniperca chuatsi]XP_044031007.1 flocculation protein FLO11-like [Siniperca chuatsi]
MMQLSVKTYLALLWGISVWFSTESMCASIPETSSVNSTAEPDKTTKQLSSPHVVRDETYPTHKPAAVSAAATAETTLSPTVETEEAIGSDRSDSSNDSMAGLVAATTSSSGPRLPHTSTAVTTATGEAQPSHNTTIPVKPTGDQLHQQSSTTSTDMTAPATTSATSAASLATAAVSSPLPTSTTKPEVTSKLPSTVSHADSTQAPVFIQNLTSPPVSTTTIMTANSTSESDSTSLPVRMSATSTTSTELSSTTQPVSVTRTHISTSQFPDTSGSSSTTDPHTTSFSTDSAISTTAAVSTSPAGILIPRVPKRLPIPTTKSTPATTIAPREVSKSPTSTEGQPCSTRGVMKHCLIAITSLAGLATIFMVSTIILCTKLSTRKYKVKKPQQATEMMCISALLPERNYNYARQRNPVTNGVLVIHSGGDSDEDGGDNLTLSSFLPENDRYV